jgi:hypothetical protein
LPKIKDKSAGPHVRKTAAFKQRVVVDVDQSIQGSMRELSERVCREARNQFSATAKLIARHPALKGSEKIDAFHHQIQDLSVQIAELLGSVTGAARKHKSVRSRAAGLHSVSIQLIERLAQIEGIPLKEFTNVVEAMAAWARTRGELTATANAALRPPVPELTAEQIEATKRRGQEKPWADRPSYHTSAEGPFEWIRENFGLWIPGLRRIHLKAADRKLYAAFLKALSRADGRLPDWLDLPSESEHRLRIAAFSNPVQTLLNKRQIERERKQHTRNLG